MPQQRGSIFPLSVYFPSSLIGANAASQAAYSRGRVSVCFINLYSKHKPNADNKSTVSDRDNSIGCGISNHD